MALGNVGGRSVLLAGRVVCDSHQAQGHNFHGGRVNTKIKYGLSAVTGAAAVAIPLLVLMGDVVPMLRADGTSYYVPGGWIKRATVDDGDKVLAYLPDDWRAPWGVFEDDEALSLLSRNSGTFVGQRVVAVYPARVDGVWRSDVLTVLTDGGVWANLHRSRWDEVQP